MSAFVDEYVRVGGGEKKRETLKQVPHLVGSLILHLISKP